MKEGERKEDEGREHKRGRRKKKEKKKRSHEYFETLRFGLI